MAGPWEEYQTGESAPWDEYKPKAEPPKEDTTEMTRLKSRQRARQAEKFAETMPERDWKNPLDWVTPESVRTGMAHGADRVIEGVKDLVPKLLQTPGALLHPTMPGMSEVWGKDMPPEVQDKLAQGAGATEQAGVGGTVGQLGTEVVAAGGPAAAVRKAGAAVLPQAVKALATPGVAAGWGARVFNPGAIAGSAVEGATSAGIVAPGEGETRGGNAAVGGVLGGVLPVAAAAVANPLRWAWREFAPTAAARKARAANVLENTIGKKGYEQAATDVENAVPSQLPLSTAGASQNPDLARLERGARAKATGWEWDQHDAKLYAKAWDDLQNATRQGELQPRLAERAKALMDEGKAKIDAMPLSQANAKKVVDGVTELKKRSQAISDPDVNKELDNLIMAATHPQASLGVLQEEYFRLAEGASKSKVVGEARDMLRKILDDRTKGGFSKMMEGYGKVQDKLAEAEAALNIQGKFMTPQGVPTTGRQFPVGPGKAVPEVQAKVLRQTLGKEGEQAGVDVLGPRSRRGVEELITELERHDLYRAQNTPGATGLDVGNAMEVAATGRNNPIYTVPGLRGVVGKVFKGANKATEEVIDQALRDPNKFLDMVAAKKALGRPLSKAEELARQAIFAQARGLGTSSVGEQRAP